MITSATPQFQSIAAAAIRQEVNDFNWNTARRLVKQYAAAGLVSYQQADKHNGGTAQVLVEGEVVGQASNLLVGFSYAETQTIKNYR